MAAAIKDEIGAESELIRGAKGIFDVVVDDQLIFSKYETQRFPEDEEILSGLRETPTRVPVPSAIE